MYVTLWLGAALTHCGEEKCNLTLYYRPYLGYSFAQSEFYLSLVGDDYRLKKDENHHKDHQDYILQQIKTALKGTPFGQADCMALDENKNSAMHLALMNNSAPSRSIIKLLIPTTNWLETNCSNEYAFDYFDLTKHADFADLILYDVIRSLCFKKKISFRRFYQCATQHHIYSILRQFFSSKERISLKHSLQRVAQRKTYQ